MISRRTRSPGVRAAVLASVMVGLAGCVSSASVAPLPPPPATIGTVETTTTAVSPSQIVLPSVPGQTTTTAVGLGPGTATLSGKVTDVTGAAVAGATVEVQRLVGDASATAQVLSGADGSWSLSSVLGGRYRVFAFRSPDLGMATADVLFLADGQSQTVNLSLTGDAGNTVTGTLRPDPPVVASQSQLLVQTGVAGVSAAGGIANTSTSGASVLLVVSGAWTVLSANPTTTDANGQASWTLICDALGPQPLAVEVDNGPPADLTLPACVAGGGTSPGPATGATIPGQAPGRASLTPPVP